MGGEFVNSDHQSLRALQRELGLDLEDLWAGYPDGSRSVTSLDGMDYLCTDVLEDWGQVAPHVERDYAAAGSSVVWDSHLEGAVLLDRMSLAEWIDVNVPDGRGSRLGRFIEITHLSEWAGSAEDQSALNFLMTVGPGAGGSMDLLGGSDERWHIKGGSDRVAEKLDEQLGEAAVELASALAAVRHDAPGVTCSFDRAGIITDVLADRVVLALPFTTLRDVDLTQAGLGDLKRRVIDDQPTGPNSKLQLEFAERAWRYDGANGDSLSDTNLMVTWEGVITEKGPTGVLVAFTGGELGAGYDFAPAHGEAPAGLVTSIGPDLETVFGPATRAAATGRGWLDSWVDDPHTRGSYSFGGVGQYTELRGAGGTAVGPIHFVGEHTSLEHQGFMNGAVETGERAAAEIIADY